MKKKFNEALVKEVREGKAKIINNDCRINELIAYIFNVDQSKVIGVCDFYSAHDAKGWCGYNHDCGREGIKVSDFFLPASLFLQPPTEKEGKERTYRVTREQLLEIHNRATHDQRGEIIDFALTEFPALKNENEFTEGEVSSLFESYDKPTMSLIFPDFNPTPHIPKGEFAWVLLDDVDVWMCVLSAGDGQFYMGQEAVGVTIIPKEVRKYEDRPF